MALEFTGERFLPECEGEIIYEHWHRYLFARAHVAGRRVLDVASGEGYGSALLAEQAVSVVGVDISAEAVGHAQQRYGQHANLRYLQASCDSIPLPDASVDVIVSFETIEHMVAHDAFMAEVDRLLAPGGLFIISSPNRVEYSERRGYHNPHHLRELDREELSALLTPRFPAQAWFAQRPCFHSLVWPLGQAARSVEVLAVDGATALPPELYFLVCCAREPARLEGIAPAMSLVADRAHSVYAEWSRTYAENRELQARLAAAQTGGVPAGPARRVPGPVQLHAVHDFGGGVVQWLNDFCAADETRTNLVLKPWSLSHAYAEGLMLYDSRAPGQPLRVIRLARPMLATDEHHSEYRQALADILQDFQVSAILVSSFIGHALDILATGLPTLVINHDFYPACPAINLYFHEVCTRCDAARLTDCAAHNPDFNSPYRVFPVEQRLSVREGLARLLKAHDVTMVVPTDSVRRHLIGIVPALAGLRFETIPHGRAPVLRPVAPPAREAGARLRVLVLGIQSVTKGMKLLFEVLPELTAFADVYLVGAREAGELFRYRPGVHVVDEYRLEDLPAIVDGIAPDCGLLLSTWPETFSYTLSELLQMHIPPVATRVGGFADRIHDGEDGILFDPDKTSLLACLRAIDAGRGRLARIRAAVAALPARSLADMVADYHRLLPPPAGECLIPTALASDPATGSLLAALDSWKRARGLGVRLDMKEGRLREVHEELERLRHEAEGLRGAVREREQRIAELHASTSWKVSRPLRWLGTCLKRLRS